MKNWLPTIIVILTIGLTVNAALYFQSNSSLQSVQSDMVRLKQDMSALTASISNLQTHIGNTSLSLTNHTMAVADTIAKVEPAIVRLDVTGTNFQASGSGSIIDSRGYVLTCYHVIDGAKTIKVTVIEVAVFDGTVVAGDQARDLALVKITTNRNDLPTVALGQPSDIIVGKDVMAVGFPLGTELAGPATLTKGIVSAMRILDGLNYIQTDALINPGNSGGCLVTLDGKMIGVPSAAIVSQTEDIEGISLAIPIDDIVTFLQKNL